MVSVSKSKSRGRPVDMTPNEFKAIRDQTADSLSNVFSGGGQRYGGPLFAPITAEEMASLDQLNTMAGGGGQLEREISGELLKSVRGDYLDPASNPYLQATADAATRHLTQDLDQAELENRSLFSRAGQKIQESSPFATAQAITNRGYADAVGDVSTQIFGGNYQSERDRQVQATQFGGEFEKFQFTRALDNLKAQELPRLIAEVGIERGITQFNEYIDDIMEALNLATGATAATLGQETDSTSVGVLG